ncbi:hypothetical protein IKQ21_06585 [bacterium]|nr:hypothetical protein [bacterium]
MIIRVVMPNSTPSFEGRLSKYPKNIMNEILTPLVENFTPLKEILKKTVYTSDQINRWSRLKFGMTITMLYKTRLKEKLKDEFIKHRKNGTPITKIAKIYGQDSHWVNQRYEDLGFEKIGREKNESMNENVPWMLDAGYSLGRMQEELKISVSTLSRWILKNKGCTAREYRNHNNITGYYR